MSHTMPANHESGMTPHGAQKYTIQTPVRDIYPARNDAGRLYYTVSLAISERTFGRTCRGCSNTLVMPEWTEFCYPCTMENGTVA